MEWEKGGDVEKIKSIYRSVKLGKICRNTHIVVIHVLVTW